MVDSATLPHWEERALHAVDDVSEHRLVQGSRLVKERDSSKRNFDDMSDAEQQVLDDFDTGRSAQRHAKECDLLINLRRGLSCLHFSIFYFLQGAC